MTVPAVPFAADTPEPFVADLLCKEMTFA